MAGRWDKTERPAALYIKSKGVPGAVNFGQGFSLGLCIILMRFVLLKASKKTLSLTSETISVIISKEAF